MELIFKESSQVLSGKPAYEVEFEASSDFSIHIERPAGGRFLVYQKSVANGKYSLVDGVGYQDYKDVFDIDFAGSVYPKWIKIVSEVEPTYAAIISDGEVTEIKAQSKVVEITSNGITNITPDEGFAYLNSVKVKTNVPQSGEGGGSASGDNSKRYFDISSLPSELKNEALTLASYIKQEINSVYVVAPLYFVDHQFSLNVEKIRAIYCDTAMPIMDGEVIRGIEEVIPTLISAGAIEITEEEFYSLDVPEVEE